MEHQYFKVGEEVALVSKNYPEANGNYTVLEVADNTSPFIYPYTGTRIFEGILYRLGGLSVMNPYGEEVQWAAQEALRKIDKGSTSWNTMMESLDEPSKEAGTGFVSEMVEERLFEIIKRG